MRSLHPVQRARRTKQRGNVIIETGFIFVVFTTMLIGMFDFGRILFIHQAITDRVRYAARWGAANGPGNTTAIQNQILYAQSTAPAGATGFLGITTAMISVTQSGAGTADNRLTVSVTGFPYKTLAPFWNKSWTGPTVTVTMALGIFN